MWREEVKDEDGRAWRSWGRRQRGRKRKELVIPQKVKNVFTMFNNYIFAEGEVNIGEYKNRDEVEVFIYPYSPSLRRTIVLL